MAVDADAELTGADAKPTHLQIYTNPAKAMVRETGSVTSQQLGQFGVGAKTWMRSKVVKSITRGQ